jgi:AraC family transcriptional activator FtrA
MLETSQAAVSRIADQAGFGSEESFRRHFRRVAGVSPAAYRRQFSRRLPKHDRATR